MGCDIHLFVEKRDESGAWKLVAVRSPCHWCNGSGRDREDRECYKCKGTKEVRGYDDRDYRTFAALADVRNYFEPEITPICHPKGFPSDMSPELDSIRLERVADDDALEAEYGEYWIGDHSYSWLTVAELLDYQPGEWRESAVFFARFLPELVKVGKPSDVRIVFGFDN
ncbi:MAG TPA: hypothetical protein VFZ21_31020 [Gemmatimonadaceae bacterium]|nr:hypothetical protein [Gemmatimonadaceae bacterium]